MVKGMILCGKIAIDVNRIFFLGKTADVAMTKSSFCFIYDDELLFIGEQNCFFEAELPYFWF